MIELENVVKTYGEGHAKVEALKGVSLKVEAGQFVSVMGPSGSGKSTLLNLVSALDVPTDGIIRLNGQDIGKLSDDDLTLFRRHTIGLVFQSFNLLPTLNALDNVLLPVMVERKATAGDKERAKALLADVGLSRRMTHRLGQLSGGEAQRVAIARSLILNPRILLADEPTGNLDSETGEQVLALFKDTARRFGMTVVMVTHDRKAAEVGDRLVTMKDGRLLSDARMNGAIHGKVDTLAEASSEHASSPATGGQAPAGAAA